MKLNLIARVLLCLGAVGSFLGYLSWVLWFMPYGRPPFPRQVEIPSGLSLNRTAHLLEHEGLLMSRPAFIALAILRGDQGNVRAGGYHFDGPISPHGILDLITRGKPLLRRITVPEGFTLAQVAERLASEGLVDKSIFLEQTKDPGLIASLLGFEATSLEGFLFPDTYLFAPGEDEGMIIRIMVKRFHEVFEPFLQARTEQLGWTVLQAITLASIIEKETSLASERSLISGVFHRRLKLGMRLESDPSVIYGLENFDGDLRKRDLAIWHPYNTYLVYGLPPGPICNPGLKAIMAALFPSDEGYLYFVSRNDGSHTFSRTIEEHRQAVNRYQRRRP